jgi:methionyl-tRNA formyltransferase
MIIFQNTISTRHNVLVRNFHTSFLRLTKSDLKVVFFGTDLLSTKILSALVQLLQINKIKELNVVTSAFSTKQDEKAPQVKIEENSAIRGNRVVKYCQQNNITYNLWPTVNDPRQFKARFESYHVGVVASFGHLIPSEIIQQFPQ